MPKHKNKLLAKLKVALPQHDAGHRVVYYRVQSESQIQQESLH